MLSRSASVRRSQRRFTSCRPRPCHSSSSWRQWTFAASPVCTPGIGEAGGGTAGACAGAADETATRSAARAARGGLRIERLPKRMRGARALERGAPRRPGSARAALEIGDLLLGLRGGDPVAGLENADEARPLAVDV